ncbi:MAG: cyclodeaminase/cyclohydrolase family protein, partial [Candidatus Acidiferrales bacterium]
ALSGALAASLGQMVAGLSRKKKAQAAYVDQLSEALADFQRAAGEFAEAIDRDAASFDAVMKAYKLPQESAEEKSRRDAAICDALRGAAEVPLEVARKAVAIYERLGQLQPIASASMLSYLRVGRSMAAAAVRGALENVSINLDSLAEIGADTSFIARMRSEAESLDSRVIESAVSAGRP